MRLVDPTVWARFSFGSLEPVIESDDAWMCRRNATWRIPRRERQVVEVELCLTRLWNLDYMISREKTTFMQTGATIIVARRCTSEPLWGEAGDDIVGGLNLAGASAAFIAAVAGDTARVIFADCATPS